MYTLCAVQAHIRKMGKPGEHIQKGDSMRQKQKSVTWHLLADGGDEEALHAVERRHRSLLVLVVLDLHLVLRQRLSWLGHYLDDVINDDLQT